LPTHDIERPDERQQLFFRAFNGFKPWLYPQLLTCLEPVPAIDKLSTPKKARHLLAVGLNVQIELSIPPAVHGRNELNYGVLIHVG
jgi:hypothetical protein